MSVKIADKYIMKINVKTVYAVYFSEPQYYTKK
jgi:hypothetical protein